MRGLKLAALVALLLSGCSGTKEALVADSVPVALRAEFGSERSEVLPSIDHYVFRQEPAERTIGGVFSKARPGGGSIHDLLFTKRMTDEERVNLIAYLESIGMVSFELFQADDMWPGCEPPECTTDVWDSVGEYFD